MRPFCARAAKSAVPPETVPPQKCDSGANDYFSFASGGTYR